MSLEDECSTYVLNSHTHKLPLPRLRDELRKFLAPGIDLKLENISRALQWTNFSIAIFPATQGAPTRDAAAAKMSSPTIANQNKIYQVISSFKKLLVRPRF